MNELNTAPVTEAIEKFQDAIDQKLALAKMNQDRFIDTMNEAIDNHVTNPERIQTIQEHSIEKAYERATEDHSGYLLKLYVLKGKQIVQEDPELAKFIMDGYQEDPTTAVERLKKILAHSHDYITKLDKLRDRVAEILGEDD